MIFFSSLSLFPHRLSNFTCDIRLLGVFKKERINRAHPMILTISLDDPIQSASVIQYSKCTTILYRAYTQIDHLRQVEKIKKKKKRKGNEKKRSIFFWKKKKKKKISDGAEERNFLTFSAAHVGSALHRWFPPFFFLFLSFFLFQKHQFHFLV